MAEVIYKVWLDMSENLGKYIPHCIKSVWGQFIVQEVLGLMAIFLLMRSVTLNVRIREVIRRFGAIIFIMIVLRKYKTNATFLKTLLLILHAVK